MTTVSFTLYRSLFDLDSCSHVTWSWDQFVSEFSTHLRVQSKEQAPGFGPYTLKTPASTCLKHRDARTRAPVPRPGPHRCDDSVDFMTLAVFDVDVGTEAQISNTSELLTKAGIAHLWYTSYSYTPIKDRPPFRLVIPLSSPVQPAVWSSVRSGIAQRFQIPCVLTQCSGLSHFYYLPSCPPSEVPITDAVAGNFLDPSEFPQVQERARSPLPTMEGWEPPPDPEPGTPISVGPLLEILESRKRGFMMMRDVRMNDKGRLLDRVLKGVSLASHGARNNSMNLACGIVAWALPGTPRAVLATILRPSLNAMQAEGSKLTEDDVDRMLLTAMRDKAAWDEREEQERALVRGHLQNTVNSLPVY